MQLELEFGSHDDQPLSSTAADLLARIRAAHRRDLNNLRAEIVRAKLPTYPVDELGIVFDALIERRGKPAAKPYEEPPVAVLASRLDPTAPAEVPVATGEWTPTSALGNMTHREPDAQELRSGSHL